jgi:predicted transcriptional regulator
MKKLNDEDVFAIKKLLKGGVPNKLIAQHFQVDASTISRIKKSILHKHIVVPSEEYARGFEEGYLKGFRDAKKFETLEKAERPHFLASFVAHKGLK